MSSLRRGNSFFLETLYWLAGRTAVFCFVLSLLALALYLLGNFQDFLDATQVLLLTLLRLAALGEILSALTYAAVSFAVGRPRVSRLIFCFVSVACSAALLLVTGFLSAWFQLPN
jgi:phage-related holin